MAIRIRQVDGVTLALCAARSIAKPDDIYLDDAVHHALVEKFSRDMNEEAAPFVILPYNKRDAILVEVEESNNPNRDDWDKTFGKEGV